MYAVVLSSCGSFDFPRMYNECQSGWCVWMESNEVADPIETLYLYDGAPLFSLGVGVHFDVLRPVYV